VAGARSSSSILGPIFDSLDFFVIFETIEDRETIYDHMPGAVHVTADFAFPFGRASARAVEQSLCAARDGTYASRVGEYTIAASYAFFTPYTRFVQSTEESRIERRDDGQFLKRTRESLDPSPTGQ
jgi:hypothetical protein